MKLYRKTYGVFGMVEWSTLIPVGNGNIRIDFSNGSMTERGVDPATFSTENVVVQMAIEASAKFKSNKIKLVKAYEIGEIEEPTVVVALSQDKVAKGKELEGGGDDSGGDGSDGSDGSDGEGGSSNNNESGDGKIFPDVKNSQQAKDVLMGEPFNIPLAELGNKTAILTKAEELGVSFSNWK